MVWCVRGGGGGGGVGCWGSGGRGWVGGGGEWCDRGYICLLLFLREFQCIKGTTSKSITMSSFITSQEKPSN